MSSAAASLTRAASSRRSSGKSRLLGKRGLGHEIGQTVRLAGPVVLANLGMMGMGFVDTVMVGRLGPVALAGVALANAVFFATIVFVSGSEPGPEPLTPVLQGLAQFHG